MDERFLAGYKGEEEALLLKHKDSISFDSSLGAHSFFR